MKILYGNLIIPTRLDYFFFFNYLWVGTVQILAICFLIKCVAVVDDTMAKDLFVSCCTEANNSVADECKINRDVKKWTSMSEESDNFAM